MKTKLFIYSIFFSGILFFTSTTVFSQYQWWSQRFSSPMGGSQDTASCIEVDNSGNVYVSGWVDGYSTGSDIILLKYRAQTGDNIWVRRYTGPGFNEDKAKAMILDSEGNVYITGFSFQPTRDIITLKYDGAGNLLWTKTYNGSNNGGDYGLAMAIDNSGNVYVTGRSDVGGNNQRITTVKYNSSGDQQWAAVYNGPLAQSFDQAGDVKVDASGNVYVIGYTTVLQNFDTADWLTVKYNSSGVLQWAHRFNGTGNAEDMPISIALSDGNAFVTGFTDSSNGNYNYFTIKFGPIGNVMSTAAYIGPELRQIDRPSSMTMDNAGNVYITGYSIGASNTYDYATIKYNSDLSEQWVARYEGNGTDVPSKIMEMNTNLYITGTSSGITGNDYLTVKYNAAGSQSWETRFNAPANGHDYATCLDVDGSENVFVSGYGNVNSIEDDIFTIRYSSNPIGIEPLTSNVPKSYNLYQNYPNPFNPSTNIKIDIPGESVQNTKLVIYDVLGKQVAEIINQDLKPGSYLVRWNAGQFSSGIYFYKLTAGNYTKTNKMVMVE